MSQGASWIQELWRIAVLLAAALTIGALIDQIPWFLLLALLAYSWRTLFNLHRLAGWLGDPRPGSIPIQSGLWGDIYARIARISSRQEQREKRLSAMLGEYARSTSALPDATVALDDQGRIRWFNDAARRLLALQTAKDVGQPLSNLLRTPGLADLLKQRQYDQVLEAAAPGDLERTLEVRIAPYGEGQVLLLAQDITERLCQERVRKDFVANVSHELRTPLTVFSGFVENLQNDPELDDRLHRPLAVMEQQAARMRQIVEDLLVLARLESASNRLAKDRVDMGALMQSVAEEGRAIAVEGPQVVAAPASTRRVLGDAKQLRSALSNLVVNAIHHTPAGGRVTLSWRNEGEFGELAVTDTGEGIAPQHIPRLTERFYRVDAGRSRERGGTGLGLAIVKHILQRHDARLEVESRVGEGSCFRAVFHPGRLVD